MRSIWQNRYNRVWSFFCPLCRTPRKTSLRPQPGGVQQVFQVILTSLVFTLLSWEFLGWKGIVSLLPLWTFFEVAYRWRLRAALSCSQCGFDPYLYRIDLKLAQREIEDHWRKKFAEKGIPYPKDPSSSPSPANLTHSPISSSPARTTQQQKAQQTQQPSSQLKESRLKNSPESSQKNLQKPTPSPPRL